MSMRAELAVKKQLSRNTLCFSVLKGAYYNGHITARQNLDGRVFLNEQRYYLNKQVTSKC